MAVFQSQTLLVLGIKRRVYTFIIRDSKFPSVTAYQLNAREHSPDVRILEFVFRRLLNTHARYSIASRFPCTYRCPATEGRSYDTWSVRTTLCSPT